MSGVNVDHGGVVSVDPDALREVARRIDALSVDYDETMTATRRAHGAIIDAPKLSNMVDTASLWASGQRVQQLRDECRAAAAGTLLMADVYEYVELQTQADALAATDSAAAQSLRLRAERLAASDDRIADLATALTEEWEDQRFEGLDRQADGMGPLAALISGTAFIGTTFGRGIVSPGATLFDRPDRVTVTRVKTSIPITAPKGLADSLRRMPTAPGAQVAVEKYSFSDGSVKYVAYLKGTQAFSPINAGGDDPWDQQSNIELYAGVKSDSYQATLEALDLAGAQPGDEVDIVAHSQTGMVAAHLAMESEYNVKVQITAGSPVEPTLREDQHLIQLRHTDDPVSALSGGGSAGGAGSPDSVTVSRVGDPMGGIQDLWLHTHQLDTYIETAAMADDSGDPRIEALGEFWRELDSAESIERTEYHAERTERTNR